MIDTGNFFLLSAAATIGVLAILLTPESARGAYLARRLWQFSLVVSVAALAWTILASTGLVVRSRLPLTLRLFLLYRGWVPLGAGLASLVILTVPAPDGRSRVLRAPARAFLDSPYLPLALAVSASLSYAAVETGKLMNDAEMRRFFVDSGLPAWGNYAVIGVEATGAVLLLLPAWRFPAALILGAVMCGAIAVHARNGDPFVDSLEAVHLLLILASVAVLSVHSRRTDPIQP